MLTKFEGGPRDGMEMEIDPSQLNDGRIEIEEYDIRRIPPLTSGGGKLQNVGRPVRAIYQLGRDGIARLVESV